MTQFENVLCWFWDVGMLCRWFDDSVVKMYLTIPFEISRELPNMVLSINVCQLQQSLYAPYLKWSNTKITRRVNTAQNNLLQMVVF